MTEWNGFRRSDPIVVAIVTLVLIGGGMVTFKAYQWEMKRRVRDKRTLELQQYSRALDRFAEKMCDLRPKYKFREMIEEAKEFIKEYPDGKTKMEVNIALYTREAEAYELYLEAEAAYNNRDKEKAIEKLDRYFLNYPAMWAEDLAIPLYRQLTGITKEYDSHTRTYINK